MFASKDINDLIAIVAALRNRDSGCIWNIKQTFESLIPYMLEEVYEVIDAIERKNSMDLCDELGDLLLQIVYHATIAQEESSFSFEDVVYAITAKMIRRHPHVFGTAEQKKRGFVAEEWERIKKIEQAEQKKECEEVSLSNNSITSILAKVKKIQPADQEALALQKAAAKMGFDWHEHHKIFPKIEEELNALKSAIKNNKTSDIEEKFGDLYFILLHLARYLNIDSQKALKKTNTKFRDRFTYIEENLSYQSKTLADASLNEMESLWHKAKDEKNTRVFTKKN
ncbi:Nucleoside triphosphate pyrophosphohydrolase/pyrophosphatase MazG [Candidatus Bartonella washoeensis]|uniref:MazG family protein n=1 Tax=Candidatus Bartonella washoeensis Sb944nv TaxID=1094563 RepID=J0Z1E2_9HYPH|nr:nucleoside triphosphate pyrophosphohydrolase [Bartonella washoeensis]EJF81223.1 MazG family protein [Bartonella washoeensis Sb944nv]SPU26508.1 Nucleoside triphosphate pyrophosphohydrolase/pyrophosphatase MazG [Bartonella washoeensis]